MIREKIRAIRKEKGISQREMARRLYKSPSAYSRMESGKVKIDVEELTAILDVLEIPLEKVFSAVPSSAVGKTNSIHSVLPSLAGSILVSEYSKEQLEGLLQNLNEQLETWLHYSQMLAVFIQSVF